MRFIIDDADIEKIRAIYDIYPADGVTTNPSILARTGRPAWEVLREIRAFIGQQADLHVQVLSSRAEEMLKEAREITEVLGAGTFIKVPAVPEGLKAIRLMKEAGIRTTATIIYDPMQAFLAGKAGASWAAPYVNRIDNLSGDGVQTAKDIHDLYRKNGLETEVLAASFRNSRQVLELVRYGIGAATMSIDVISHLMDNRNVDAAAAAFTRDFEAAYGSGAVMHRKEEGR